MIYEFWTSVILPVVLLVIIIKRHTLLLEKKKSPIINSEFTELSTTSTFGGGTTDGGVCVTRDEGELVLLPLEHPLLLKWKRDLKKFIKEVFLDDAFAFGSMSVLSFTPS